jgi:hypothetical protein
MEVEQPTEWELAGGTEVVCESATLSTTNRMWPDLDSNPDQKPANTRLSYDTADQKVVGSLDLKYRVAELSYLLF